MKTRQVEKMAKKKQKKHMMKPWGWAKKRKKLLSLWKKGKRKLHKAALHKAALHKAALLPNRKVLLPVREKVKKKEAAGKKTSRGAAKKTTKLPGSGGEGWALGKRAKSTKKEREAG